MSDYILEFAKSYRTTYKKTFNDNASALFDQLVKDSDMDVNANRKSAQEYRDAQAVVDNLKKKANKLKVGRGFAIFSIVVGALAIVIVMLAQYLKGQTGELNGMDTWQIITMICGVLLIVGMALLIKYNINPKLRNINNLRMQNEDIASRLYSLCMNQIAPLHVKFDIDCTRQLCMKTMPQITLDKSFTMGRYDHLRSHFGLQENLSQNESTIGVFSGEIYGNPFIEERRFICTMGTETYHGSIVISWTATETDSNGNTRLVTKTQTLHANVVKPKPYYQAKTYMIFGSDVAPDLSFSHEPTHAERWTEGELKRKVKRGARKIEKIAEKSLAQGGNFTEFGNEEFDVIFNATERDHEVQFRLLFTPLAQENLLDLMKNPDPYGDDFYFIKSKKLNYISSEHGQLWDFDPTTDRYKLYDVDLCKEAFLSYNNDFFRHLVFELAPIMCIPLYQQHKTREYIYRNEYERNCNPLVSEVLVNAINQIFVSPDGAKTPSILKTQLEQKEGAVDKVTVTAYAYTTEPRVDYVSVWGGDGRFHQVPVPWQEYIPVQKQTAVQITQSQQNNQTNDCVSKHGFLAKLLNLQNK